MSEDWKSPKSSLSHGKFLGSTPSYKEMVDRSNSFQKQSHKPALLWASGISASRSQTIHHTHPPHISTNRSRRMGSLSASTTVEDNGPYCIENNRTGICRLMPIQNWTRSGPHLLLPCSPVHGGKCFSCTPVLYGSRDRRQLSVFRLWYSDSRGSCLWNGLHVLRAGEYFSSTRAFTEFNMVW